MSHEYGDNNLQDSVKNLSRTPKETRSGLSRESLLDSMVNLLKSLWEIPPVFHETSARFQRKPIEDDRVKSLQNFVDTIARIVWKVSLQFCIERFH